jgi:uncharacterized protein YjiS (DUF1127 family)
MSLLVQQHTPTWREWLRFGARLAARDAARVLGALSTWQERSRQRHLLASLPDRMLKDMGLTRADVEAEVRKPIWVP